ncbi:hypothetical protein DM860_004964 [Cuscuta australis]|uniref:Uncharacterized protein n=1 Tax=Cuscuta australis TaxID=267555 RepID=A0A328DLZ5_9ASTE|nr:hypothetical protein DM860_004964 [Cuscuta australis]
MILRHALIAHCLYVDGGFPTVVDCHDLKTHMCSPVHLDEDFDFIERSMAKRSFFSFRALCGCFLISVADDALYVIQLNGLFNSLTGNACRNSLGFQRHLTQFGFMMDLNKLRSLVKSVLGMDDPWSIFEQYPDIEGTIKRDNHGTLRWMDVQMRAFQETFDRDLNASFVSVSGASSTLTRGKYLTQRHQVLDTRM